MFSTLRTTTARELQKNYRKVFNLAKKTKEPIFVMKNNKPEVVIVDAKKLEEMYAIIEASKLKEMTEDIALKAFQKGKQEFLKNKLQAVDDLSELL